MNSLCRSCLTTEMPMFQVDDTFCSNYFLLTNIQIKLKEDLPQNYCTNCADMVASFIQFREQCLQSESYLQDSLEKKPTVKLEDEETIQEIQIENENERIQGTEDINEWFEAYSDNEPETSLNFEIKIEKHIEEPIITKARKRPSNLRQSPVKRKNENHEVKSKEKKNNSESKEENSECFVFEANVLGCGLCMTSFNIGEDEKLKLHLETHRNSSECEICFEGFIEWSQLLSHRIIHLAQIHKVCFICKDTTRGVYHMEFHYRKKHTDLDHETKCKFCMKKFKTPRAIIYHVKRHQQVAKPCSICKKSYLDLQKHMLIHGEENTVSCSKCSYTCKTTAALGYHNAKKHNKTFCKKCHKFFTEKDKYDAHECKENTFICTVCGKEIKTKRRNSHLNTHDTNPHYKCAICPAEFRRRGNLKSHMDRHNKKPRHECEFCKRKFYDRGVLIKHRRIHTGEKPHVCKICNKGFTATHNLKVHMKVHGLDLVVKRPKPGDKTSPTDKQSE